jgi:hypothetical protein
LDRGKEYNGNSTDKKEYRGIIMKDKEGVIKRKKHKNGGKCPDARLTIRKKPRRSGGNDITKEKQGR